MTARTTPSPTLDQWRLLYDAADAFRALGPWKWMSDSMIFGVRDPVSGVVGYCSVLGALGEMHALNVYLGPGGLTSCLHALGSGMAHVRRNFRFTQHLLMAEFEDRSNLQTPDLDTVKALGRKYRGTHAWPMFRDHSPGLFPWYISADQAEFLTHALTQASLVASRATKNPDLFLPSSDGTYLVRTRNAGETSVEWTDTRERLVPPSLQSVVHPIPTARALGWIQKKAQGTAIWELEYTHVPTTIQEKKTDRPYYPKILVCVDTATGQVILQEMFPRNIPLVGIQSRFLLFLRDQPGLPAEIHIRDRELEAMLLPIARLGKLTVRSTQVLPATDEMLDIMDHMMLGGIA